MEKLKRIGIGILILVGLSPLFTLASLSRTRLATLIQVETGEKRIVAIGSEQASNYFDLGYQLMTDKLGASYAPSTGYSERLAQTITNASATIYVSSVSDRDGVLLPLSATNKGYFTIEPSTSRAESVVCTGVSSVSVALTGCTRGLAASGSDETGSISLSFSHNAASKIIMTDLAQFFSNYVDVWNAQTINGAKTFTGTSTFTGAATSFTSIPTSTSSAAAITTANQLTNKAYVDAAASATSYWTLTGSGIYYNAGKVGIGTTTPGVPLQVNSASNGVILQLGNALQIGSNSGGSGSTEIRSMSTNTDFLGKADNTGSFNFYGGGVYNSGAGIWLRGSAYNGASSTIGFVVNAVEKMKISATGGLSLGDTFVGTDPGAGKAVISGTVGIGTTTVNHTLEVAGSINASGNITGANLNTNWTNGIFTKNLADATASTTIIAHNLNRIPALVEIICAYASSGSAILNISSGSYNGSTYATVHGAYSGGATISTSYINRLYESTDLGEYQTATVTTFDATNIILTWAKYSTPTVTYSCSWKAN
jgi:hypothetical protein